MLSDQRKAAAEAEGSSPAGESAFIVYAEAEGYLAFPDHLYLGDIRVTEASRLGLHVRSLLLSGGDLRSHPDGRVEIRQTRILTAMGDVGAAFAEAAVAALTSRVPRLTIVYPLWLATAKRLWPSLMEEGGFRVETEPDLAEYAVAQGAGKDLRNCHWLEDTFWGGSVLTLGSAETPCRLEREVHERLRLGESIRSFLRETGAAVAESPELLTDLLAPALFATSWGGPDINHLSVVTASALWSPEEIRTALTSVAEHTGVALFDAGNLRTIDEYGCRFADFPEFLDWRPCPTGWSRR
jgi:hypothetical protein